MDIPAYLINKPSDLMIDEGRILTEKLIAAKVKISFAGWMRDFETGKWTLFFSVPELQKNGPKSIYLKIINIMNSFSSSHISTSSIGLIDSRHQLLSLLKMIIRLEKIGKAEIFDRSFNGTKINDTIAYIVK